MPGIESELPDNEVKLVSIPGGAKVREELALDFGGSREVNGERLRECQLSSQYRSAQPLARLLKSLIESGKMSEQELKSTLEQAYKPVKEGVREITYLPPASAESQVLYAATSSYLNMVALLVANGNPEKAAEMVGRYSGPVEHSEADLYQPNLIHMAKALKEKKLI